MRKKLLLLPVVAGFLLASCTTMGDYDYTAIDRSLESQGYQAAYEQVEDDKKKMYSSHDEVLLNLDNCFSVRLRAPRESGAGCGGAEN